MGMRVGRYLPRALCGGVSGLGAKGAAAHGVCSGGFSLMARVWIVTVAAVVCDPVVGVAVAPAIARFGVGIGLGVISAGATFECSNLFVFVGQLECEAFNGGS